MQFEHHAEQDGTSTAYKGVPAPGERDQNGRFVGSGNPKGRPRKVKLPKPTTFGAIAAAVLREPMMVKSGGKKKQMPRYEVIARRVVSTMLNGDGQDLQRGMKFLAGLGAFNGAAEIQDYITEMQSTNSAPAWTDELEAQFQVLAGDYEEFGTRAEER